MVAVQFSCPHCAGIFQVDSSMSGQQVTCPHCGNLVGLPAMGTPGPVAPAPVQPASFRPDLPPGSPPSAPTPVQPASYGPRVPTWPVAPAGRAAPSVGPGGTPRPPAPTDSPRPHRPLRPVPLGSQTPGDATSRPLTVPGDPAALPSGPARLPTGGPRPIPVGGTASVESLLPPSAAGPGQPKGGTAALRPLGKQQVPEKQGGEGMRQRASGANTGGIVLPTENGNYVSLRDPVKTIGRGDEAIELRTLSPEEKARRKLRRNLVLWGFGLLIIGITLALLLLIGPLG